MRYFNPCKDSLLMTLVDSVGLSFAIPIICLFLTSNSLLSPLVSLRRVMQLRLLFEWTIKRPRGAPPIIQFLFNRLLYSYTRALARQPVPATPSFSWRESSRKRERGERSKKGVDTSKDKRGVGERTQSRGDHVRSRDYCRFPDWQSNCAGILLIFCRWQGAYYEKRKLITATAPPPRRSATCIDGRASQTRPGLHRRPRISRPPWPSLLICAGGIGYARVCSRDRPVKPGY